MYYTNFLFHFLCQAEQNCASIEHRVTNDGDNTKGSVSSDLIHIKRELKHENVDSLFLSGDDAGMADHWLDGESLSADQYGGSPLSCLGAMGGAMSVGERQNQRSYKPRWHGNKAVTAQAAAAHNNSMSQPSASNSQATVSALTAHLH